MYRCVKTGHSINKFDARCQSLTWDRLRAPKIQSSELSLLLTCICLIKLAHATYRARKPAWVRVCALVHDRACLIERPVKAFILASIVADCLMAKEFCVYVEHHGYITLTIETICVFVCVVAQLAYLAFYDLHFSSNLLEHKWPGCSRKELFCIYMMIYMI